jgi:hypothetical protein
MQHENEAKGFSKEAALIFISYPRCGAKMKVIVFLTNYPVVDRIINHLHLTFIAERPPPPPIAYQQVLAATESSAEYFS